ncbi:threonine synthase [Thalassiosira pseudonana CCMP1335]|uniref:Threonine synthase n=1 Tax=Thalassiosira pseudonana TaxID=35128 RepID=B8BRC6_THAPS|nr:threonine synthase [Thalassiosira pseudonana CCMP1335]EED96516.1 threonine synthase [Thalassiosira pseudonana CCMP1335]
MRFKSTRDASNTYSFEQALCSGYAPDGGLFVPALLPSLSAEEHLIPWSTLTFPELAFDVLRMFISPSEISDVDLKHICAQSFTPYEFDDDDYIPIKKLNSVYLAELFHGPTFCFKDFGMRPVIYLLSHFASLRNQPTTLLVATTGDTGPAAVHAVGSVGNPLLTIIVHYPENQISEFQRKQLTTVDSKCVKIASFEGGGDDMDWPIKETGVIGEENKKRSYCGINSYNIGRPLVQMVHFVISIVLTPSLKGCIIDAVLPTGAMGNMTGGYMAKLMGVPIGKLCAGVNINDITYRVIERGEFHKEKIQKTLSDAINIEVPYNFERILYYLTRGNNTLVKQWMQTMEQTQQVTLDGKWLERLQTDFCSARITDDEMCSTLRRTFDEWGYVVDPHTAVALAATERLGYQLFKHQSPSSETKNHVVVLATASPCKFQEAVTVALGEKGWEVYIKNGFPSRARDTMDKDEMKPYHYTWREGATVKEVQSEWRLQMLEIVNDSF